MPPVGAVSAASLGLTSGDAIKSFFLANKDQYDSYNTQSADPWDTSGYFIPKTGGSSGSMQQSADPTQPPGGDGGAGAPSGGGGAPSGPSSDKPTAPSLNALAQTPPAEPQSVEAPDMLRQGIGTRTPPSLDALFGGIRKVY